jgi:cytochrome c oxidase subunit 2
MLLRQPAPRLLLALLALTACVGPQSALDTAGHSAERIAELTLRMSGGAVLIWVAVVLLALYWHRRATGRRDRIRDRWLVVVCGAVVPTLVLTALLIHGLALLPSMIARAPAGSRRIEVVGEQWWWRVRYPGPDGDVVLANEIRLPVGEPVQLRLESADVIHSFWVPSLAGKMDMIPGRVTHLALHPTRTGVFRGACAEYCGAAHAWMALYVEVMPRDEFGRWLEGQAAPAPAPRGVHAARGGELFSSTGCGACHAVRGTDAKGSIGPDLTHVGSRLSLAAGALENDVHAFRRWLVETEHLKPGVLMPHFAMLPPADLAALAAYLEGLQ